MIGIYPGSFDPITNGHLDIVTRAARHIDHLVVAVLRNAQKRPIFSIEERMALIAQSVRDLPNVEVASFEGLLVDFARQKHASVIIRGLRAISDFEAEFAMASMNRRLAPEIDTMFLMTNTQWSYLSSSMIKEIAAYGGDISTMVPPPVHKRMLQEAQRAREEAQR